MFTILPARALQPVAKRRRGTPTYLLVVLGSGGHTAEMFLLLRNLDTSSYTFRRYVISSGDNFSASKAAEFEDDLARTASQTGKRLGSFDIRFVPRAREIHQSLITTPLSAAICMIECIGILRQVPSDLGRSASNPSPYPDIIITNGPATATIMLFASFILKALLPAGSIHSTRCLYVESWARVRRMSLSGRVLRAAGICDRLLVQWPALISTGSEYKGQLVS